MEVNYFDIIEYENRWKKKIANVEIKRSRRKENQSHKLETPNSIEFNHR